MHLKSSEAHNDFNVVSNFFCLVWSSMVSSFRLHLNAVSTSCVYNIASLTTWFRKLSMLIVGKTCNIALLKSDCLWLSHKTNFFIFFCNVNSLVFVARLVLI
jgi:hypothetical protein